MKRHRCCGRAKASPQTNLDVGGQQHVLKAYSAGADLKQNVGTFLAFLCSSNWNKWYVSKQQSKGPGEDFKVCGMGHEFSRELGKCNFPKHMSGPAFTCLLVQATTSREQNCNIFMRYMK